MERPLRIGINALYLIPGGVGGTEIYLRGLLTGLGSIDPVNRYYVFTNRETGLRPHPRRPQLFAGSAACAGGIAAGPPPVGADNPALRCGPPEARRPAKSRIHGAAVVPVPPDHGVSRFAAQTPPGVFPLVRPAVLEFLSFLVGARFAPAAGGVGDYGRRPPANLPPAGIAGAGGAPGSGPGLLRHRRTPPPRAVSAGRLHPASAQEPGRPAEGLRRVPQVEAGVPPGDLRHPRLLHRAAAPASRFSRTGGTRWSFRAGCRANSSTTTMRAPGPFFTLHSSKASDCPCSKRWRPASQPRAPRSSRSPESPGTPPCSSIRATSARW